MQVEQEKVVVFLKELFVLAPQARSEEKAISFLFPEHASTHADVFQSLKIGRNEVGTRVVCEVGCDF